MNATSPAGLPFSAKLTLVPVLGDALWQVTPDAAVKDGLGAAFAPGYDVPDAFVEDFDRMTYTSYSSVGEERDYSNAVPLDTRIDRTGIPLLAIFGAEDQIYDSKPALRAYAGSRSADRSDPRRRPLAERREAGQNRSSDPRICGSQSHAKRRHDLQKGVQNRDSRPSSRP